MLITLISPDKTSMAMFVDFYMQLYDRDAKVFDTNSLFSGDIREKFFKALKEQNLEEKKKRTYIVKFFTKPQTDIDQLIGEGCREMSDLIIRFDMFSTHPELIKDNPEISKNMMDRWEKNIKMLNDEA